jgi:hypothetical protein
MTNNTLTKMIFENKFSKSQMFWAMTRDNDNANANANAITQIREVYQGFST